MEPPLKKCSQCQIEKHINEYYKDNSTEDKLFYVCKQCCSENSKRRKSKNENLKIDFSIQKTCSQCHTQKSASCYCRDVYSTDGLCPRCKECECKKQKAVRDKNREKNKRLDWDGTKECSRCHNIKPKTMFYSGRSQTDGLSSYCKPCSKIIKTNYLKQDLRRFLLSSAKYRAKKKHLPFSLTKEDIIIPKKCPIFNIPLHYSEGGKTDNSPTIDRINNSNGYTKENIVVISYKANRIKNNATIDELRKLSEFYMRAAKQSNVIL